MNKALKRAALWSLMILLLLAGCTDGQGSSENEVYVDNVGKLAGINGFAGTQNRFAGMVEPQATMNVNPEQGRTVKTVFVEEGTMVTEGDPLFVYDTSDVELSLEQAELEIERIDNSINTYYSEIATLEDEKKNASEDNQLQYTVEIQNRYASIRQEEYNKKVKQSEIEKLEEKLENDTVVSQMTGVIQTMDKTVLDGNTMDMYGQQKNFITIMAAGEYRVKAKINEQNMSQIAPGDAVIVRSRVYEDQTWSGVISEIDTSQTDDSDRRDYYYGYATDSSVTSSKYPFYVVLDSYDGLILGQHVYVELASASQNENNEPVLALPSVYIVQEGSEAYVWAEDNGKLVKRKVTLGAYYEVEDTYEILDGLSAEDYIAAVQEGLKEGQKTTRNFSGMNENIMGQGEMMP